ncbi:hypothetical protein [Thalassospira xiamenensis]|uniref:hypothetical protein n=1 Tax=Thalassospira xiamenensis TaxID=220697 RepID=UPI0014837F46|nr:hypothetical protein [Thalassospira xiamenensis]
MTVAIRSCPNACDNLIRARVSLPVLDLIGGIVSGLIGSGRLSPCHACSAF